MDSIDERARVYAFGFSGRPDMLVHYTYATPSAGTYRPAVEDTAEVWECPRCAALVQDPPVHITWHDKLGA